MRKGVVCVINLAAPSNFSQDFVATHLLLLTLSPPGRNLGGVGGLAGAWSDFIDARFVYNGLKHPNTGD